MKTIFIAGAGRSSVYLIEYLKSQSAGNDWQLVIADREIPTGEEDINPRIKSISFDVNDETTRDAEVSRADLVISLLPARFHPLMARSCLKFSRPLFTASYESPEMKSFEAEVNNKGLFFLNECGLDPGLDHMSAMRMIDRIKNEGHKLACFESFTGGLVAPESDDNPWNYKFSWNPRNVVLAGQDGPAKFIQEGKFKYIPYNRLFRRTELITIEGYGTFEGYANRDSLKYIGQYGLQGIPTIYRGTLRRPGFCRAWNVFVQLGATDDSYLMENVETMTHRDFINSFLYYHPTDSVELKLYHYMHIDQDSDIIGKLEWLGIFDNKPVGLKKGTPAQILEHILKEKWELGLEDKDMIVMWHKFVYSDRETGQQVKKTASLAVIGEGGQHTAMAKTVGLPIGVAAKLFLTGKLNLKGLYIPTKKEIYEPVLSELEKFGIEFMER